MARLALKVDVDTLRGHRDGVPRLLRLFAEKGVRASFFFSFGPDNSGRAIRRIFRPGFLAKMRRTNAPGTYGLATLFYGTLLPAPLIVASAPEVVRDAVRDGHDCGVHAWDHVTWQDRLDRLSMDTIEEHLRRAFGQFEEMTGTRARACAAPGWQASVASLAVQENLGLAYASDVRGREPFVPVSGRVCFTTPQIPTTLPTLDEIWGLPGLDTAEAVNGALVERLGEGLNVHTIHAEMEGMGHLATFAAFIDRVRAQGVDFVALDEIAASLDRDRLPKCPVVRGTLEGRAGTVAMQGEERPL